MKCIATFRSFTIWEILDMKIVDWDRQNNYQKEQISKLLVTFACKLILYARKLRPVFMRPRSKSIDCFYHIALDSELLVETLVLDFVVQCPCPLHQRLRLMGPCHSCQSISIGSKHPIHCTYCLPQPHDTKRSQHPSCHAIDG